VLLQVVEGYDGWVDGDEVEKEVEGGDVVFDDGMYLGTNNVGRGEGKAVGECDKSDVLWVGTFLDGRGVRHGVVVMIEVDVSLERDAVRHDDEVGVWLVMGTGKWDGGADVDDKKDRYNGKIDGVDEAGDDGQIAGVDDEKGLGGGGGQENEHGMGGGGAISAVGGDWIDEGCKDDGVDEQNDVAYEHAGQ
jgi:hypothetical protein